MTSIPGSRPATIRPPQSGQVEDTACVCPQVWQSRRFSFLWKGMVTSQRGLHGGFTLALLPSQLSLLDVINKVDPIQRIKECPLGRVSHGKNLCGLHYRIDAALALIEDSFRNTTIEDLCTEATMNPPICPEGKYGGKRNKKK